MVLSRSDSGKTYLQERVSDLIPAGDKIEITQNAFYYFKQDELKHKLLLVEDLDGAETSLYPLRELQSKRRITKTVTLKDNKGNLKTVTVMVDGPVSVSGCASQEKLYEDNANRCLLLYVDANCYVDLYFTDLSYFRIDKKQHYSLNLLYYNDVYRKHTKIKTLTGIYQIMHVDFQSCLDSTDYSRSRKRMTLRNEH